MFGHRLFKVLGNLVLLMVFCTGQVTAAPSNSANEVLKDYSSPTDRKQNTSSQVLPTDAAISLIPYTAISAGNIQTCRLSTSGGVKCWGGNTYGQLGNGTNTLANLTPGNVVGMTTGVSAIAAGTEHTCALTSNGGVKCWGRNTYGQLGNGTNINSNVPVDVSGLTSGVSAVVAGIWHTCALTSSGGVKCWGTNSYGALGNGTGIDSNIPVDVSGLTSGVSAITIGGWYACALTNDGSVKCWGQNSSGQLGDGTNVNRNTPVDVVGLTTTVSAVSAGNSHTCALTSNSGVKCWGSNEYGQLGNGTNILSRAPVDVVGLTSGVSAITEGGVHGCALTSSGGVKCWGYNSFGELGNGTNINSNVPVDVSGLTSEVSAIATGYYHSCALISEGGSKCWGYNYYGQLGDGTGTNRYTPVDVIRDITISGNVGIGGATLSYEDDISKSVTADVSGIYSFSVPYNWSGTVTPTKAGYAFSPTNRVYTNVQVDQTNQDYTIVPAWTVMVYLAGDNNLDPNYMGVFNQLENAGNNPNTNIVVAWDRRGNNNSAYYQIEYDTDLRQLATYTEGVNRWNKAELNMGDPANLSDFIQWARTNYPAQHYALLISDHGTGLNGTAIDDSSGGDLIKINELSSALSIATSSGSNKLDILFADSCLMGMIEAGYQIRNYANLYIASENLIWIPPEGGSRPYSNYVAGITTSTTPQELTATILAEYSDWINDTYPDRIGYTLSAVDLTQINSLVDKISNLSAALQSQLSTYGTQVQSARNAVQKFDSNGNKAISLSDEYVDLTDLASELKARIPDAGIQNAAQEVIDAANTYVIGNTSESGNELFPGSVLDPDRAHGVAIFFPIGNYKRSFYNGLNIDFASDAIWNPQQGDSALAFMDTVGWGSFLVDYVENITPSAGDDPNPPDLAAPVKAAVVISGNAGVAGASLSYLDVTSKTATSDTSGFYSFTVPYGWSGTVTPSLAGYIFAPGSKSYNDIETDQPNEDYSAAILTHIKHAKPGGSTAGSCDSWANACELHFALSSAVSGDEVWVKAGTYKPTGGTDRTISFVLKNGVAMYGGFDGTETLRDQRDPATQISILSGDIGAVGVIGDNAYHVVVGSGTDSTAVLDGFTITGGNANGDDTSFPDNVGGGLYNSSGDPTLIDLVFTSNAAGYGAGMFNYFSDPAIAKSIFISNTSSRGSGGMANSNSSPTLNDVTFNNNQGHAGGGMSNDLSNPILNSVTFTANNGYWGGGVANNASNPILTNVTFSNNIARDGSGGGGMLNGDNSNPTLTNVTFSGNMAGNTTGGRGMYNYNGSIPNISNSIFWNNGSEIYNVSTAPVINDSIIQGGCPAGSTCTNIITADPKLSPLANNGGYTQTFALLPGSPAIDAGNNITCAAMDQRGIVRPQGDHCDIGAYEYVPVVTTITRVNTSPTNLVSVDFTVTFSESVTGVDTDTPFNDFALTTTGVSGASITGVHGSGATRTITVNTGSGNGTIRLDVVDDDSIKNASNNPLGGTGIGNGAFTAGEVYIVEKPTNVEVYIGTSLKGSYILAPRESTRRSYVAVNNGPVIITNTENASMIAAERVIYEVNGVNTGFTEMMGLPDSQLDTTYWLPWYNNKDLDTQLRIANVSGSQATVTVTIGGVPQPSFNLAAGASTRVSYAGVNNGPVKIVSTHGVPIVAAERVIYKVNNINTSFSEMMGLPQKQLDNVYYLPWYNNVDLDTQLRIANVSGSSATVAVTIGGVPQPSFTLAAGASTRVSYPGVNNGPVKIVSTQSIVVAERVIYKVNNVNTSFTEMMALPANQLNTTYWLPWYNNAHLDTQLRIANVSGTQATVTVTIGGVPQTPIQLPAGASTRVSYSGVNAGPVKVLSTQTIVAAERVIYKVNNIATSFSEMMGLPASQLDTSYWLPWYNNVDLDTQLRFGVP